MLLLATIDLHISLSEIAPQNVANVICNVLPIMDNTILVIWPRTSSFAYDAHTGLSSRRAYVYWDKIEVDLARLPSLGAWGRLRVTAAMPVNFRGHERQAPTRTRWRFVPGGTHRGTPAI